ncbi:O-fucosyltransferase 38 isoform X1 [Physcomitrium patens]|nr:O-fucosyltransferase 38-like [Physcomitrium patens]XP_024378476.1 O-fucosyltransferase 38-like [Physcomitrium patens]XP_024378477.1 O-fucosyltransferase 38-like [Physcomitrium patens]XP_024378478.1 O-fucosyltransferase 38-like [Physcomitrium patens]XP_024378479.1 O-fucosyltransferase 38-like [Physcomitrium patens]XP_024378480.1 O-fucosyltransferase 38-like [Physcomitrium patens]XP_024378481.1 O-fucosyltransferase 38-like [Physcomitrium patens]XP_024378483.1 O-fucosyltransferase 38-like [P|eukprot:XP_024378475.1 O-fucosyltransferase 38-like [Physcomitrella patens]
MQQMKLDVREVSERRWLDSDEVPSQEQRSTMHRHASQHTSSLGRRLRVRSGAGLIGFLWMLGYVSVVLGALFSTFFFPDILSMLRSQRSSMQSHMLYQRGDHGVQPRSDELNLRQEFGSHRLSQLPSPGVESVEFKKLWKPPPNRGFHPCVEPSESYSGPGISRGYLLVQSNGGLNQMRAGICDMVAVARILNATLVVPELDKRSFWQDSSNFSDIFDVDHFIEALRGDVHVVKSLPQEYLLAPKAVKQFQSWSNVKYYVDIIAPVWRDYRVIRASKSDSRLANNDLPADIQKLRCRVHYDALRFSCAIDEFGKKLVERLRRNGPYIALHLRYEKDMLAFSGCTHGLTHKEADELTTIRQTTAHWKVKDINSTDQRVKGYCPLTPKEVGIFLKALGYPETTPIYIAAGEIYGGDERMKGLLSRFPNVLRKETVATPEELAPFVNHSSQLAALDYIVSVESNVFVPSYSGNMARAVEGHRRYLEHRKTITPDRKELVALFDKLDRGELTEGPELAEMIANIHKRRQGAPRKRKGPITGTKGRDRFRTEEVFYTNPLPDCLCSETDPINIKPKIFNTDRQLLSHDPQWRDGLNSWQRH